MSEKQKSKYKQIAERMKKYEEQFDQRIDDTLPYIIRLDGHCFHTWANCFMKPFDHLLHNVMVNTSKDLLLKFNARTVYTQSDEITMIFPRLKQKKTDDEEKETKTDKKKKKEEEEKVLPFSGRAQKIATLAAGYCSARFNYWCIQLKDKWPKEHKNYDLIQQRLTSGTAHFDGRVFNVPDDDEILNNIMWRANYDCARNSRTALGRFYFPQKTLMKMSSKEVEKKVLEEKGVDWNSFPGGFKWGAFVKRELVEKEGFNPKTSELIKVMRSEPGVKSFPIKQFSKDYVDLLLVKYWNDVKPEILKEINQYN